MPIDVVMKPEVKPMPVSRHPPLTALRVVSFIGSLVKDDGARLDRNGCDVDDILFTVDSGYGQICIINASRNRYLTHANKPDEIFCLRAYDVEKIVLTYDGNPAPAK